MPLPKKFKCEKCEKSYAKKGNLERHSKTHEPIFKIYTWIKGVILLVCGISIYFFTRLMIRSHMEFFYFFLPLLIVIIFVYFADKYSSHKYLGKKFFEIFIIFIAAGMLVFIGQTEISGANFIEDSMNLDYGNYKFRVEFSPTDRIDVNKFLIFFDSDKKRGNISFGISKIYLPDISNILIDVPEELEITDHEVSSGSIIFEPDKDYDVDYNLEKKHHININDFKDSILESRDNVIRFVIQFNGDLIPSGKFDLRVYSQRVTSVDDRTFEFVLGNYFCAYPCFAETSNVESYIKNNVLVIKIPEDYYEGVPKTLSQEFWINTLNKSSVRNVETKRALGISVLAASIILLVQGLLTAFMYTFGHQ